MKSLSLLFLVLLMLCGCGYTVGSTPSNYAFLGNSLAIAPFINETPAFGAEAVFTAAAREAFAENGAFVMKSPASADYFLMGKIIEIEEKIGADRVVVSGYRSATTEIKVTIELALVDRVRQQLWHAEFVERGEASGSRNNLVSQDNRKAALFVIAKNIMQKATNRLGEGF